MKRPASASSRFAIRDCRRSRPRRSDLIKAKDGAKFVKALAKLTAACNSCHEAAGVGFIKIRDPRLSPIETSPFRSDQGEGRRQIRQGLRQADGRMQLLP